MKKVIWFLCIYNLILILFSFPTFALVKSGYNYDKGPLGIGVKPKDCKPFEKDKNKMILYENEWAMIFSNANITTIKYSAEDQRFISINAEYTPHTLIEPHPKSKECNSSSDKHKHKNGKSVPKQISHKGKTKIWQIKRGGCFYRSPCNGKKCGKAGSFKYPNPMMMIQVTAAGPIFMISDSLNNSSILNHFNYSSLHGLVGGSMTNEREFVYIINNIADIKNEYLSGVYEEEKSSSDDDDSDDGDDSWDYDEYGEEDDWDVETDPDTGHSTVTYKWAELEELAGSASGSYKSNGSITYTSAFNLDSTYPLSGTSDMWFTDGNTWYYKYVEGNNPRRKWVKDGSNWWFITNTSRTTIDLSLPPTEPDPATGDPGGEERTKTITVWEVIFAQNEYVLISSGAEYKLYEFDDDGYLTPETTDGYKGAKFNKSGKVIKS